MAQAELQGSWLFFSPPADNNRTSAPKIPNECHFFLLVEQQVFLRLHFPLSRLCTRKSYLAVEVGTIHQDTFSFA